MRGTRFAHIGDRTLTRHLTQVADGFMQLLLSNVPSSADHQFQSEHTNMQPLATNTPATNTDTSKMWLYISKLRTVIILYSRPLDKT